MYTCTYWFVSGGLRYTQHFVHAGIYSQRRKPPLVVQNLSIFYKVARNILTCNLNKATLGVDPLYRSSKPEHFR